MGGMDVDRYGEGLDYDSDDIRKDAELVSTGLHELQLTEEGGDDDGQDPADVCRNGTNILFRRPNS